MLICIIISFSIFFSSYKLLLNYANWWTGLFLLGILPVLISDYFKDNKTSLVANQEKKEGV